MKELFSELSLKDIIKIIGVLVISLILINSHYFISVISTKINQKRSEKYTLPIKANLVTKMIKEVKYETQIGSQLKKKGYNLDLSYSLYNIDYDIKVEVLYSNHIDKRLLIDNLLNTSPDSIWLLVNPKNKNKAILKLLATD